MEVPECLAVITIIIIKKEDSGAYVSKFLVKSYQISQGNIPEHGGLHSANGSLSC
jgi:hypothetical protein